MPLIPTKAARAVAAGLLAFSAPLFAGHGETPRAAAEMRIAQTLAGTPWEGLVDALEQGPPGLLDWKQIASFPSPTFTVELRGGLGMLEVRGVGKDHRGSPVQVFYTIPADTCIRLDAVSRLWPTTRPFYGPLMPGADSEPKDGLQLDVPALHRRVLYLVDPRRTPCLREVLINDTNVHWGMSVEDVEKLRKK